MSDARENRAVNNARLTYKCVALGSITRSDAISEAFEVYSDTVSSMGRPLSGEGYAFVPREVVMQPAAFGKVLELLDPAPPHTTESERYRAAMIQHVLCATARQALLTKRNGESPARFVRHSFERGLSQDRVRRVFRGATMAQFADFAFWAAHFPEVATAVAEYTASWASPSEPEPDSQEGPAVRPAGPMTVPQAHASAPRPAHRMRARSTPQHPFS